MIKIEHVAFWTEDLERVAGFYAKYFNAMVGERYVNPAKRYESRFLSFAAGARIEIMKSSLEEPVKHSRGSQRMGLTHLALSVGSEQRVDDLTSRLRNDGFEVVVGPRRTGDGYFESVILDADGNRIEITA